MKKQHWHISKPGKINTYPGVVRLTDAEKMCVEYIISATPSNLTQFIRKVILHYITCNNHAPEDAAVIRRAKALYLHDDDD